MAEFDASVERVWKIWADARQLERWWGPPTWLAGFDRHDFVPGGKSSYYMTGPEGKRSRGWWVTTAIHSPDRLAFNDGCVDENGELVAERGVTRAVVTVKQSDRRTRMTITSSFENSAQLEKMLEMGMEKGMRLAMGQIDSLLADLQA